MEMLVLYFLEYLMVEFVRNYIDKLVDISLMGC